jgi:DNA topoisomerase I
VVRVSGGGGKRANVVSVMATSPQSSTRSSGARKGTALVIVESPAKAKKIAGYLGDGYVVESSIGHIRDLPGSAAEVPESHKGLAWAKLGVDVDNDFAPLYVVAANKKAQVAKLKALLKDASELYLATDDDREGEAISWHLLEVLKPKVPVHRMVFGEITPDAIRRAVENPRELDTNWVSAQETRRILDRLYGYEVSPVLWKKITAGLSAGRVQSVATRLIVERERARMRFHNAEYWDLQATFAPTDRLTETFGATMVSLDGKRLATGKDFGEDGLVKSNAVVVLDELQASTLVERLGAAAFAVRNVEEKPYRRSPYAPFMTSTLQQEAGRKLRFSSQRCMSIAQKLYENGYITYMRTDSSTLSDAALSAARKQVLELYGKDYLPDAPRKYANKVKNAQEAHEAIRPAGDSFRTPAAVANELNIDELKLYELIWMRTVASQMNDARGMSMQVRLGATATDGRDCEFVASGKTITFPGFLRAYVEGTDDPDAELEDREVILPTVAAGNTLRADNMRADGHSTQPPARYTEASLVKMLEEKGVGRPSTYASIIGTIQNRGYVWKKGSALVPAFVAFAVVALLEQHFGDLVDYEFTARMEDDLDSIASGQAHSVPWLRRFYFGEGPDSAAVGTPVVPGAPGLPGLRVMVQDRLEQIDAATINSIPIGLDDNGELIVVRPGRYGPYVKRGDDTAPVPDELAPDELTVAKALELLAAPKGDRIVGVDPVTELNVYAKAGRFGPYVQLGDIETLTARAAEVAAGDGNETPTKGRKKKPEAPKPRTASLFKTMTVDAVTLDEALSLLTLPRSLGIDEATGEEVVAQNGRYGPYLKKGVDSRTIGSEEELLTITLEQALTIYSQPKVFARRGQGAPKPPLATFGDDPISGKQVIMKEGRFGLYVTDGVTNASLRRGDDPETINVARVHELLAERRIADLSKPAVTIKRGGARKATGAKKAAAPKKSAAPKKAAAKKTVAKGAAAKKSAAVKS